MMTGKIMFILLIAMITMTVGVLDAYANLDIYTLTIDTSVYTPTIDSIQYLNGTDVEQGDTITTKSTRVRSGTLFKNGLPFEDQEVNVEFKRGFEIFSG